MDFRHVFGRKQVFPHSNWLVLVYASCHTEAQTHSHFFMENHHLHFIIVLREGEWEKEKYMNAILTFQI